MDFLSAKGLIFDIKKFSVHDGPGIRTTVFFKGCPLRCRWCHNPESQRLQPEVMLHPNRCIACLACLETCPQGAVTLNGNSVVTDRSNCLQCGICTETCFAEARQVVGREMSVSEVVTEVQRDISFYEESGGGVTFSGGDPLLQPDFLLGLLHACKEQEIHTVVDTSGSFPWRIVERIRPFVDLFLYDVKLIDDERHKEVTGVSNRRILANLEQLSIAGQAIVVRLAVIPGINDDEQNIRLTGEFLAKLPNLEKVALLPYHASAAHKYAGLNRPYQMPDVTPPDNQDLLALSAMLRQYGLSVAIGG